MDTFDLLPSLAAGELAEASAPELVAAIFRSRASGTLSIEGEGGVEIRQFFRAGDMCGSAFFAGFRTLAQVLLANDWVNALEIDASLAEAQASGKRHGQVLVEKGLLRPEQLTQALYGQHQQNLLALLSLDRGHYEMRGWEPPPAWSRELSIDPVSVLVTALESERMAGRRQRVLDWLGNHAARLSVDWPEIAPRVQLDSSERRAAALLALPRRLTEFVTASRLPQARAEALLVTLLLTGGVEAHPSASSKAATAPPEVPSAPPSIPHYVPSTAPPPEPEALEQEPNSEPILIASGNGPASDPELVPLETEAPPKPLQPAWSSPPQPSAPPSRSRSISPGMPLFSRPSAPPRPVTNTGYSIAQPSSPSSQQPAARPATNPGYLIQQPAPSQPPRPVTNTGYSIAQPPAPAPQQPAARPATNPGYLIDDGQARPVSNPSPRTTAAPRVNSNPNVRASAARQVSEPPMAQPPPPPPGEELVFAPPPPVLTDEDAFAKLEALAMEELGRTREEVQPVAPPPALDENEVSHSGLRRLDGGGFEFDGRPGDSVPGIEKHATSPERNQSIPAQDDAATAMRKKMRARGMRNLGNTTGRSAPVDPDAGYVQADEQRHDPVVDETLLSFEDRRFIDEVRARAKVAGEQDAWLRLGVARSATSDQIRAAYLDAAKRFHPDRASAAGFAGVQEDLRTLFTALKEAYDLIATAPAREQYAAHLKTGTTGKVQARKEEAAMALKMGEVLLKKRDFAAALSKLRRSVEIDPNGDSLAALAWGLMCDPATSPAGKEEATALINRALRANGLSARTYYVAGVLWRTKDPDSAADAFRKALELEPNHADASLELRLLEMRQGKKSSGGGVLSGLLFGKRK